MDAHGYILKGNSRTAGPDYIPSMIGVEVGNTSRNRADPYFERVEIVDRQITSLQPSRWATIDDADPILEVRSRGGNYYIPAAELYEIAAANHDDDTIDLLEALASPRKAA